LSLVAGSLASHSPAFFWSGRANMGLAGGDHFNEIGGADLQQAITALSGATSLPPLVSSAPAQAPEVQVVFMYDMLSTEDVRSHGGAAFPKLQKLMAEAPSSLSVPFTTRSASAPLHFAGAKVVPAAYAESYLTEYPQLAKNGKTDIMLVNLPMSVKAGKRDDYIANDDLVGRVTAAVAKATEGNYAVLLTGATGSDVEHVTMRRRLQSADSPTVGLRITPNLMAALMVSFLLIIVFLSGFCCLFSLQTPKKFEEPKQA